MGLFPLPNEKLICPRCGGDVTSIHPYYTAAEKSFDLQFFHQWWLYPLAGLIGMFWWPLGLAALVAVFLRDLNKAKRARLYRCRACDAQLSYEEATTGEKQAT
jgi:hypothetical protein